MKYTKALQFRKETEKAQCPSKDSYKFHNSQDIYIYIYIPKATKTKSKNETMAVCSR